MSGFGVLFGVLMLPLVGAGFILCLRGDDEAVRSNARWAALATTIATFLLSLFAWSRFDPSSAAFQLVESHAWLAETIRFKLGVDGLNLSKKTSESWCDRPTWSPAPFNEIAYASRSGPGFDIRVIDVSTGVTKSLTFTVK